MAITKDLAALIDRLKGHLKTAFAIQNKWVALGGNTASNNLISETKAFLEMLDVQLGISTEATDCGAAIDEAIDAIQELISFLEKALNKLLDEANVIKAQKARDAIPEPEQVANSAKYGPN